MTHAICQYYFQAIFSPNLSEMQRRNEVVVDGHESHFSYEFVLWCKTNGTTLAQEPAPTARRSSKLATKLCSASNEHGARRCMIGSSLTPTVP